MQLRFTWTASQWSDNCPHFPETQRDSRENSGLTGLYAMKISGHVGPGKYLLMVVAYGKKWHLSTEYVADTVDHWTSINAISLYLGILPLNTNGGVDGVSPIPVNF